MTTSRATTDARPGRPARARRSGFSLLEVQVAFVVFGIALAGLCPLVVIYQRLTTRMEARVSDKTVYYLSPAPDGWARKLGVSATVAADDPGPPADAPQDPARANDVAITAVSQPPGSDGMTVHVSITARSP